MKWIRKNFSAIATGVISSILFALFILLKDWLFGFIEIRAIWLFVIGVLPTILFFFVRAIVSRFKQEYKTKDLVNIIADERKFMVIRYHFWRPYYAICKECDKTNSISVHQKYLSPYIEPKDKDSIFKSFSPLNINKNVPVARIKSL